MPSSKWWSPIAAEKIPWVDSHKASNYNFTLINLAGCLNLKAVLIVAWLLFY